MRKPKMGIHVVQHRHEVGFRGATNYLFCGKILAFFILSSRGYGNDWLRTRKSLLWITRIWLCRQVDRLWTLASSLLHHCIKYGVSSVPPHHKWSSDHPKWCMDLRHYLVRRSTTTSQGAFSSYRKKKWEKSTPSNYIWILCACKKSQSYCNKYLYTSY
jgi:hypothetical protein